MSRVIRVTLARLCRATAPVLSCVHARGRAQSVLAFVVLTAFAALAAGCGVHPAGTNDGVLSYVTPEPPPPNLASLVRERLAGAQIVASVEGTDVGVSVTVDRDQSGAVDALLSWRGGLAVYDLAPEAALDLDAHDADAKDLERRTTTRTEGLTETYYVGSEGAVARAIRRGSVGRGLKALAQTLDPDHARTLVVHDAPRVDLSDAVDRAVAYRRTLEVTLSPRGAKAMDDAGHALGPTAVAIARDRTALRVEPIAPTGSAMLTFSLGDDLAAYASARALAAVLSTPTLPVLTRASAAPVPIDWPMALTGTAVPFLLSLAWLFFVRRFDRAQPEPWWLVLATFFLGCASVAPAALAELGWMRASEWLDPSLVTMGGAVESLPIALPVFALVIGLSEEGSKFLGAWSLAYHRREFDEPIDGIVYGAASALGFAAVENVKYFAVGRMTPALVVVRMFMSVPAHLFFGAIWGYALGRTLVLPRTRVLVYLALAAIAHGTFDTLLSYPSLSAFAFALNLGLATLFVVLLRQSLRHGVVTPATNAVDPNRRLLFVVGSGPAFVASAIALHVVAAMLFLSSAYMAGVHERVGLLFVLAMSSLVILLGVAAYFLSATMPLDVVLDDHGLTFAGATRSWGTIRGIVPSPRGLHVRSSDGDVWIGPASKSAIEPIARALAHKLSSVPAAA